MSNFVNEAEGLAKGFEGNQQQQNSNQDNLNNQNNQNQQNNNSQRQGNQQQSSGGFMGGAMQAGEDGAINTELNSFMTKEGIPAGADGAVDAFVDKEANQYLGGNKNF